MKKKIGFGIGIVIIAVAIVVVVLVWNRLNSSNSKKGEEMGTRFSKEIAPYTKSESETYHFETTEVLHVSAQCCNIVIQQKKCSDITIELSKLVGDKREEHLQEELDQMSCKMENGKIFIGYSTYYESQVNSKYFEAKIIVPKTLSKLELVLEKGNLDVKGDYRSIVVDSNVGNVDLDLKKLEREDVLRIDGKNGNVNIMVPKKSKVNITGTQKENVQLTSTIQQDEDGITIEINKSISRIKIS